MATGRQQEVAVVGSPSSTTELTLDLLQEATEERLVGALTFFQASQNGLPVVSVGQVVGVQLRNRWHEDSVFRNLIKRTGDIPPITNRQDTRTADLLVGATFRSVNGEFEPDTLGMVPPTGTRVSRVDQELLNSLLAAHASEIVYLGQAYANDVMYPMWFKHFDSGPRGAGEAYHLGVFGKTGSGKSALAKMMLTAYAKHPELGILIIDPQGEFSDELNGTRRGRQGLPVDVILKQQGRELKVYRIADLQLDEWDTFETLLHDFGFCGSLGVKYPDNAIEAAYHICRGLKAQPIKLSDLNNQAAMMSGVAAVQLQLAQIYASPGPRQRVADRIQDILAKPQEQTELFQRFWSPLANLFSAGTGRRRLYGIVDELMGTGSMTGPRPVVAIDLSQAGNQGQGRIWTEELEKRLLARLLSALVSRAAGGPPNASANVLVVLDEAHRHAPSGSVDEDSQRAVLRNLLRRAVRETRKYGLGWFFISQTLGGLDREILQQLRILSFGFGLALGSELDALKDFVGGDKRALDLYQSFRDPQSFPGQSVQEFPFMAVGPISPLSFSGRPVFFSAFTDHTEFSKVNRLLRSAEQPRSRLVVESNL
jgi:hypothetical protein